MRPAMMTRMITAAASSQAPSFCPSREASQRHILWKLSRACGNGDSKSAKPLRLTLLAFVRVVSGLRPEMALENSEPFLA
jgi:hypothetical protein